MVRIGKHRSNYKTAINVSILKESWMQAVKPINHPQHISQNTSVLEWAFPFPTPRGGITRERLTRGHIYRTEGSQVVPPPLLTLPVRPAPPRLAFQGQVLMHCLPKRAKVKAAGTCRIIRPCYSPEQPPGLWFCFSPGRALIEPGSDSAWRFKRSIPQ